MEGELSLTPEQLANLSPEALLKLLDSGWPWPLDAVQEWFEDLWQMIIYYFYRVVDWIYYRVKPAINAVWGWIDSAVDWLWERVRGLLYTVWDIVTSTGEWLWAKIKPAIDTVWTWLQERIGWLWSKIESSFTQVWSWLQTATSSIIQLVSASFSSLYQSLSSFAASIAQKVTELNAWFSNEFIDPFIDWLVQFPKKLFDTFIDSIFALLNKVGEWFTGHSPGFWEWYAKLNQWISDNLSVAGNESRGIFMLLTLGFFSGLAGVFPLVADIAGSLFAAFGSWLLRVGPAIGSWFASIFSSIGGWLLAKATAIGLFFRGFLSRFSGWFLGHMVTLLGAGGIITLEVTGQLEVIIRNFVTPAIIGVFDWFEAMGPVTPKAGKDMSEGVTRLAEFTISGLAAMTLAGEMLAPLKHVGLGHLSAIIYDFINYKTLTAAFMGVLAFVYIKTPLTYYYQKVARPNLPDEKTLGMLASEYQLADAKDIELTIQGKMTFNELAQKNEAKFVELMAWHGYPDEWSKKLFQQTDTPMRYFALGAVARQGMWDEEFMRDELRNSGYSARGNAFLLDAFRREATGELRTLMVGAAMKRFREGLDDVDTLSQNLTALGVQPTLLDKYIFAAQLDYLTDYQTDLLAYYKDAYHRREIEEPEFRRGLASLGLNPQRLDLTVARESIKRLKPVVT